MSSSINWRERFVAAGIHLIVTAAVAALAAALIFFVWFPGALADMAGGRKLFLLVTGIDMVLGPLISLVIYNSTKSRGKLLFDYTVVGALQLAAIIYGVSMIAISRPLFIVFTVDRLEIVTSQEIDDEDLSTAALPEFQKRPLFGPKLAAIELPRDPRENNALIFSSLSGKDVQMFPKYYRPYTTATASILEHSLSMTELQQKNPVAAQKILKKIAESKPQQTAFRFLQAHSRFGFWTAVIDPNTAEPIKYLSIDLDDNQ